MFKAAVTWWRLRGWLDTNPVFGIGCQPAPAELAARGGWTLQQLRTHKAESGANTPGGSGHMEALTP